MNILQLPNAVFFIGLVIQFMIRHHFIQRTRSEKKTVRQVDRLEKILLAAVVPAALLLPTLYCFTPLLSFADYDLATSIRSAGSLIMVASLWLFWRSHVDLGQNWSVSLELRQNHQLVSHGVYRRVRHPMYASIWLWGIAQGMMLSNWFAGWTVVLTFAAMYFIRTPREERLMCREFGEGYREYARRTGRLFPRLTKTAEPAHPAEPAAGPVSKWKVFTAGPVMLDVRQSSRPASVSPTTRSFSPIFVTAVGQTTAAFDFAQLQVVKETSATAPAYRQKRIQGIEAAFRLHRRGIATVTPTTSARKPKQVPNGVVINSNVQICRRDDAALWS